MNEFARYSDDSMVSAAEIFAAMYEEALREREQCEYEVSQGPYRQQEFQQGFQSGSQQSFWFDSQQDFQLGPQLSPQFDLQPSPQFDLQSSPQSDSQSTSQSVDFFKILEQMEREESRTECGAVWEWYVGADGKRHSRPYHCGHYRECEICLGIRMTKFQKRVEYALERQTLGWMTADEFARVDKAGVKNFYLRLPTDGPEHGIVIYSVDKMKERVRFAKVEIRKLETFESLAPLWGDLCKTPEGQRTSGGLGREALEKPSDQCFETVAMVMHPETDKKVINQAWEETGGDKVLETLQSLNLSLEELGAQTTMRVINWMNRIQELGGHVVKTKPIRVWIENGENNSLYDSVDKGFNSAPTRENMENVEGWTQGKLKIPCMV